MKKKLFDVQMSVWVETTPTKQVKLLTSVPPEAPTLEQLVGLQVPVMSQAMALIEQHLALMFQEAQMRGFEASLGMSDPPNISEYGGRDRPSAN